MSANHGTGYTLGFAAAVCLVCSVFVCLSAVLLKDMQESNKRVDQQKNVLKAAGLIDANETIDNGEVAKRYEAIKPLVIDLKTGSVKSDVDATAVDMRAAVADSELSRSVDSNDAKVLRVPNTALVYQVMEEGKVKMLVLPVSGKGLWSTMHGFLALDVDTTTVRGVSFYEHGETPGLGGEVENPRWTGLWKDRKVYNDQWEPAFAVLKGPAKSPTEQPHNVDGLSGATLTCKGVTGLVNFWIGQDGFGPFLKKFREGGL